MSKSAGCSFPEKSAKNSPENPVPGRNPGLNHTRTNIFKKFCMKTILT
jgi:hypothetical protein